MIVLLTPLAHSVTWNAPSQLTTDSITHVQPSIGRDGTRITYIANPGRLTWQIFVVNSDGTGITQLTNNSGSNLVPSINGNGTLVVFYSNMGGSYQIYKIKSDGTGLTPLTSTTNSVNTYPVISSDGSRIAFESNRTGLMQLYSMYCYTSSHQTPEIMRTPLSVGTESMSPSSPIRQGTTRSGLLGRTALACDS